MSPRRKISDIFQKAIAERCQIFSCSLASETQNLQATRGGEPTHQHIVHCWGLDARPCFASDHPRSSTSAAQIPWHDLGMSLLVLRIWH